MKPKIARRWIKKHIWKIAAKEASLSDSIYYTKCMNALRKEKKDVKSN